MEASEKKPKVSVTVVTYNHGHWLAECLESIVTQETDFPFEVIVGDDASTDELTREILVYYARHYPDIIVPVFREKNIGPLPNYFDVVQRTKGEYIAHIDGDDRMLPWKLQKQADFLDAHPECSIVAHNVRVVDANNKLLYIFGKSSIPEISDINYLVQRGCFFSHSSKMYRRKANLCWFRNEPTVDFFLHIEHASQGFIGYIPEIIGEYRKSVNTLSYVGAKTFNFIFEAYMHSYDRALKLGVNECIVEEGRMNFIMSRAVDSLRIRDYKLFEKIIKAVPVAIDKIRFRYRFIYKLKKYPMLLNVIVIVRDFFVKGSNMLNASFSRRFVLVQKRR